jgi:hypothetical protein
VEPNWAIDILVLDWGRGKCGGRSLVPQRKKKPAMTYLAGFLFKAFRRVFQRTIRVAFLSVVGHPISFNVSGGSASSARIVCLRAQAVLTALQSPTSLSVCSRSLLGRLPWVMITVISILLSSASVLSDNQDMRSSGASINRMVLMSFMMNFDGFFDAFSVWL